MIWNTLFGAFMIALAMVVAFGIIYFAGWIALAIICLFEDNIIPFIHKKFQL